MDCGKGGCSVMPPFYCDQAQEATMDRERLLIGYSYNFCWAVRTLRVKTEGGDWRSRTPAMAAGLADHVWSLSEWLTLPAVHHK